MSYKYETHLKRKSDENTRSVLVLAATAIVSTYSFRFITNRNNIQSPFIVTFYLLITNLLRADVWLDQMQTMPEKTAVAIQFNLDSFFFSFSTLSILFLLHSPVQFNTIRIFTPNKL